MLKINVNAVLAMEEMQKNAPPTLPPVKLLSKSAKLTPIEIAIQEVEIERITKGVLEDEIRALEIEMNAVRLERDKLSSKIWKMVEDGASQEELRAHYERIESFRPQMIELWKKVDHARRYNEMPKPEAPIVQEEQSRDLLFLKDQRRSLENRRDKARREIRKLTPLVVPPGWKEPEKLTNLRLKLDQLDAEYKMVKEQLQLVK
jgi:hypothetical protein